MTSMRGQEMTNQECNTNDFVTNFTGDPFMHSYLVKQNNR